MDDLKLEDYIKHIRTTCIKNDCNDFMFSSLKNLQYFDRNQWKKLDRYLLEELGLTKRETSDELEMLKKSLKEKEELIKKLIRENMDFKNQIANMNQ